jgi:uncharacterized membrane protein YebE (DUF533 family)
MSARRHWSGALAAEVERAARQHVLATTAEPGRDGAIMPHGPAATDHALRLVRAMIAATKADGRLTDDERERLLDRIGPTQFDPDVQDWLQREFRAKLDIEAVVEGCCDSPRRSVEVYLASLMAIDLDQPAEHAWLRRLAGRLGLERRLVDAIHAKHGAPALDWG